MKNVMPYVLSFYNGEVSRMICQKYGMEQMTALRKFVSSQTYAMLIDENLEMWEFSPIGIFDMWESEQITGNPRNSLYIRRD